ncbi:MAG: hypothetical protein COZ49_04305 [Candidatus Yonathbacteria bacterium CG_4_10_14_3_um_filter_47_65]|uniref:Uncharacterized protein n=2 Tax=Parcubacteria group TaxID=1794811 RepID=A0A2M8DA27_9BACT|nr:MAG: hypothetical protein AUJ44_03140 [Candidatus Nomurabacteria bacterium CG1_02_47_685]PIP03629.1 MAG: hypothetical protein COX54_02900 [Candidatus Yonathbacteria bacterium CG23_combo_of_CG06-09_8_20_14_all_46_18]PIQ33134.1 MAG: hypothetical protein COW61_00350 [Candidatus Yonathbacteria bacterium CG17_big_fil_post_rev_8_21_14_2_50_46_19]PIX56018.1 MAG: hypothetical protein COZ49_04305 [Candidatus Yonathbacteria bacterium CG_4_10_14_3_um_filter_47_65]PIY57677.1 MAG: hypothetical protein CO
MFPQMWKQKQKTAAEEVMNNTAAMLAYGIARQEVARDLETETVLPSHEGAGYVDVVSTGGGGRLYWHEETKGFSCRYCTIRVLREGEFEVEAHFPSPTGETPRRVFGDVAEAVEASVLLEHIAALAGEAALRGTYDDPGVVPGIGTVTTTRATRATATRRTVTS